MVEGCWSRSSTLSRSMSMLAASPPVSVSTSISIPPAIPNSINKRHHITEKLLMPCGCGGRVTSPHSASPFVTISAANDPHSRLSILDSVTVQVVSKVLSRGIPKVDNFSVFWKFHILVHTQDHKKFHILVHTQDHINQF